MREIKFRGKTFSGEWVYGNLTVLRQTIRNVERGTYISNDAGLPFAYRVMPETVGQFTGIRDNRGIELYEEDICHDEYTNRTGIVRWIQRNAMFRLTVDDSGYGYPLDVASDYYRVVGTTFDNPTLVPELLDVEP